MQKLRERMKDQKGFTLVEMLIVVAIIAILIAVSMPMVTKTLEKARHGVDEANFRNAISLANIEVLSNVDSTGATVTTAGGEYWYYINDTSHQGELVISTGTASSGFTIAKRQCTQLEASGMCSPYSAGTNIKVTIESTGSVKAEWATKS